MANQWRFYVYRLTDEAGNCKYIGKGSGRRLLNQRRAFGLSGDEIARFKREADAYAFEVRAIAEQKPELNKHAGGNGSKAQPIRVFIPKEIQEIERIGTRRYAAMILLGVHKSAPGKYIAASKIDAIRQVAHG